MEQFFNILIVFFVIASIIFRVKQAAKTLQKKQFGRPAETPQPGAQDFTMPQPPARGTDFFGMTTPAKPAATGMVMPEMVIPATVAAGFTQLGFNSKNLDKIVSVYGQGASLSTDEVSILLNTSTDIAQQYLDQLASQGRAEIVTTMGGKTRYKLT